MFEVRFPICIAVLLLFPAGPLILTAQPTGIEQSSEVLTVPTGDKFLRWHGHAGRTYFVQVSDTTTPLAKWRWATVIERGDDEDISYEVDATASSGFFRLRYTDQFVAPDEWLEFADFDGDGLVNIDEIDPQSSAAATDPLSRDTDSDGMDDAYESRYGFDGSNPDENGNGTPDGQDDSDGDGLSNVEEGTLGTNPTFEDSDDDGELDGAEVAGGSDPLDEVKALRPGTYSVTGVRGEAGPNGLPSVGEGGDTVFYEKITYTNDLTSSSSGTDGGGSTSYSATSNYIQNSEWTRSPLETLGNISSWTWTKEDHQEGSFDSTQTRNDAEGHLEFSEVLSFACSRDLTPLTTIAVSGSKVTTQPPGGPVTSTASRAFPLIEEGLSVPNDAEPETPSGSDPTVRKWSRTHADGDGEETWEIDGVIPWETMAEESRVAAKANTSENQSYTSTFTFGEQIREQGDTFIVMAQGGRAIDGGGSYERYEVGIDAEDQGVVLRKVTEQYRADDFVSAAHRTVTYQTVQPGQTATVIVEAEPSEGYDQVFITLDFSLVEIRSRDRGFTGSVFLTPGPESSLNFRVGNKDYGTFSVPSFPAQESGSFICPNGYRMFGFVETDNHDAWKNSQGAMSAEELGALQGVADNTSLPGANPVGFGPLPGTPEDFDPRAISQEVAFWWEGTRLHFASVSDDLGSLEVAVGFEGENAPPVSHALESEPAFERVIAAAEGLIAGDDPPEIKAWQDYPEPLDDAYPPPPVLNAAQQDDLMAAAPPAVDEEFGEMQNQNPAITLQDAETFFWLVARVDEEPVFADDNNAATEEWTATDRQAFLLLVASHGYNYSPNDGGAGPPAAGGAPAAGAANAMAAGWRGTPTTRTEITLPAELRNRGLLAKALKYLIERAVKGQLAYAEGTIFGVWDGIKGDVVGVADTVRMAAGGWDDAAIFIGRYLKDPYRVAAELNATFELVKEVKWSQVKANVKGMVDEMLKDFVGNQEDRLKLVLGDECEDPLYLTAYLAGYTGGFIGEQVGVAFFTAGISKAGVISQVLRAGRGAVGTLMGKAAAKFPQAVTLANGVARSSGVHVQNLSKGLYGEFSRTARSADELRATRRNASLCRTAAGCLAVGTLVAMADGSYRPIENVHTGDSVMTIDMENGGSISTQPVETQVRNEASRVFRITWDRDGDQVADGWVAATPEHPFWTEENGWTRADTLRRGMRLRTSAGTQAVVLDAMQQLGEIVTYNLDVSGPDTFLIGSHRETAILVHNLEGDVYPWHAPHRGVGQSAVLNFFTGQPAIHPSTGLPVIGNNPQHHFHYDAWLRANYTNLEIVDRRVNYPVIELTYEQHYHAHQAGEDWLLGK